MKNIYKSSSLFILLGNLPILFFLLNNFYAAPAIDYTSNKNLCIHFDGQEDYISTNSPITGNPDFTVEFWFQSQMSGGGNGQSFVNWTDANNQNRLQVSDINGTIHIVDDNFNNASAFINPFPAVNIRDGVWHHFAFAKSGNNVTVFLDNASFTYTTNVTGTYDLDATLRFGRHSFLQSMVYEGLLEEVRIWNFAKNSTQVAAEKDCALNGNETGLLLYYNFDLGTSAGNNTSITQIPDLAGGDNNGDLMNFSRNGMSSNLVSSNALAGCGTKCISGTIAKDCEKVLEGVKVYLNGDITDSTYTDANGCYNFFGIPINSNVNVSAVYEVDSCRDECINQLDVIKIRSAILNIDNLDFPFGGIAADVNGSSGGTGGSSLSGVSTFDEVLIRQTILGQSENFYTCWRFLDPNFDYTDPTNGNPDQIDITNISQDEQVNFTAVQIGDVTGCCDSLSTSFLNLYADTLSELCENVLTNVTVPIRVRDFNSITGLQFSLNWDPANLQFVSTQNYNPTLTLAANDFGTTYTSLGQLGFGWYDNSIAGITLSDNQILFEVEFNILTPNSTAIHFGNVPTDQRVVTFNLESSLPITHDGLIMVDTTTCPLLMDSCVILSMIPDTVCQGDQVCIDITVQNFVDIASMQASFSFDPMLLQFQQFQGFNLSDLSSGNFLTSDATNGTLAVAWFDPTANGVSISDNSAIFQICFTALQSGATSINFSNSPSIIEIASPNQQECFTTNNGLLTIENNAPPTLVCNDNFTINLSFAGEQVVLTPELVIEDITLAHCGVDTIIISPDTLDCNNVGINNIQVTMTDINGNIVTCFIQIEITDSLSVCLSLISPDCDTAFVNPQILVQENCVTFPRPLNPECNKICDPRSLNSPIAGNDTTAENCIITCDSSIQIYHAVQHLGSTYHWTVTGGNVLGASNLDSVVIEWGAMQPAGLTLIETTPNGCVDSTTICIEFIESPTSNFTYAPVSPCANTSISFTDLSTNAESWFWNFGDGNISTDQNPTHAYSTGGLKTVCLIVSNSIEEVIKEGYYVVEGEQQMEMHCDCVTACSCTDTIKMNIFIDLKPAPPILCAATSCVGDTACYTTPNVCIGGAYNWVVNPNGLIVSGGTVNDTFVCVQWLQGDEGIVKLSVTGCTNDPYCATPNQVTIPIIDPDVLNIIGDTVVCENSSHHYAVPKFMGVIYDWQIIGNGTITTTAPYQNNIAVDWGFGPTGQVVVNIQHIKENCASTDTLTVNIKPEYTINGEKLVCENDVSTYFATPILGYTGDFAWTVSGGTIQGATIGQSVDVLWNTSAGYYTITATPTVFDFYCNDVATYTVEVAPKPVPPFLATGPTVICPGGNYKYTADASPLNGDIYWTITGGTVSAPIGKEVLITWGTGGIYQIDLYQQSSKKPYCISDTVTIIVEPVQSIMINGNVDACINSTGNYFVDILPLGTLPPEEEVIWTISPTTLGSITAGQGTTNIDVLWNNDVGTATLTADYCGGTISHSMMIQIITPPLPSITGPASLCSGITGTVNVIGNYSSSSLVCLDQPGLSFTTGATTNPAFNSVIGGCCYLFKGTDMTTGCELSDTICIDKEGPTAEIFALSTRRICEDAMGNPIPIDLSLGAAVGSGYTYQWEENCSGTWLPIGGGMSAILNIPMVATSCSYRCVITQGACTEISNILNTFQDDCIDTCNAEPYTLDFTFSDCGPSYAFTSTSSANVSPSSIFWEFGDGQFGNGITTNHSYDNVGSYFVCVNGKVPDVNGVDSCIVEYCDTLIVPMVVDWDWQFDGCSAGPAAYKFTNLTLLNPQNLGVSYLWTFTDDCTGSTFTSTDEHPVENICSNCGNMVPVTLEVTTIDKNNITCTDTVSKMIDLAGSTPAGTIPLTACVGEKVTFSSTSCGAVEWLWNFGDGASSALENPCRTYTSPNTYTVTLTTKDEYGCESSTNFSQSIIIHPKPTPIAITAAPSGAVCAGETVTLTATPSGMMNYEWFDGTTNLSLQSGLSDTYIVTTTGFYYVEVKDNNNCKEKSADIPITVFEFPSIDIAGNLEICLGDALILTATDGYSYDWKWNGSSLSSINELNYSFLPAGSHTIELTITQIAAPTCSKVISIPVTVHNSPASSVISSVPTTACEGDIVVLSIVPIAGLIYNWSNGMTGSTITLQPALEGAINVTATNPITGCSATSNNTYVYPLPDVCVVPAGCFEVCNQDTICLPDYFAAYQWLKDGVPISASIDNCLTITESGDYQVILTSAAGCVDTSAIMDYTILNCGDCCTDSLIFCQQIDQGWTVNIDSCTVTISAPQFDTCSWLLLPPDWGDGSSTDSPNQGCDNGMIIPTDGIPQTNTLVCCNSNENVFVTKFGFGNYDDTTPRDEQLTICPPSTASAVFGLITHFDLAVGDTLFVYDGEDTTYPIIGKWTGAGISQTGGFISANSSPYANPSGCLTFRFKTNGDNINAGGWRMEIGCNDRAIGLGVNNYFTHTYDSSGTYIICATVYNGAAFILDSCMSKQICDTITVDCGPRTGCVEIVEIIQKEVDCNRDSLCFANPFCQTWLRNQIQATINQGCTGLYLEYVNKAYWNGQPVIITQSSNVPDRDYSVIYNCAGDTLQICQGTIAGPVCDPLLSTIDIFSQLTNVTRIWDCGNPLPPLGPDCFQNFGASYEYCLVVKNKNVHPATGISLQPSGVGALVTVSPSGVTFNPPLASGAIDTIDLTLFTSVALPGDTVKLHLGLYGVSSDFLFDWGCMNEDTLCLVLPPCPPEPDTCCNENNSLIANGSFSGYPTANLSGTGSPWIPTCRTPQIYNNDGCDSLGYLYMWGNELVGECTEQRNLNIEAGKTYRLSFCAKYITSNSQAPNWAKIQVRAGNQALPEAGCPGICEEIYTTPEIFNTDWANYCFEWTPQNDYDRISLRIINDQNIDHGEYVSYAGIDDVCLELTKPVRECCTDYNAFCKEIENQVNIDINTCKVTVNIGNLQECTEINDIFWGDGTISNGPFINGSMPMHNYASDGNYIISWIVFERDAVGDICFEKVFRDTIQVNCLPRDTCQANFDWVLTDDCLKINLTSTTVSTGNLTYEWFVGGMPIANTSTTMWVAPDTGIYEICLAIMDDTGCKDTLCQDVGIYDEIWPIIQCPADISITVPACDGGAVVNFDLPFTADSCGVDSIWCDYESGHFFECGTTTVTCYVRDIYGHESGCSFKVTVNCECAQIIETDIICGDSATGYNFCIYVEKLNGSNDGNCDFSIINSQNNLAVNIDNVNWIHSDTAKITGTIGSARPIPKQLNFDLAMECACPEGDTISCVMPVNFLTPCCDSIYLEGQEVCHEDDNLLVALNGSIDFNNIAQTIWYVSLAPCPTTPFGGTPYQVNNGYADLLLLPNYLTGDVCIYAEVIMANGPCKKLISNLDIIEVCQPVTCSMQDTAYCYTGIPIIPAPICIELDTNGQNCEYTIIWKDENGDTIVGENGLKYQPPAIDFMGAADACAYEVRYTAIINSVCGASSCTATIRLDNDNAAVGQLSIIYPSTAMPFCPGQDATIQYNPACVGTPPMWFWHESTDGTNFTAIPSAGNQNPVYNTNRLFTTTWFMVTKQNGACTTLDTAIIKIDIKEELSIIQFTATPLAPCRTTGVGLSVDFNPCTANTGNSCDCDYDIDWYKDGQLIHTGNYGNSPATFDYTASLPNNDYSGNYYAVVKNNCCDEFLKTIVIPIDPPMIVAALGPCFQCYNDTINLEGVVEYAVGNCTYQWYEVVNTVEIPISGATNLSFQTTQAGTYIFEATCGTCTQSDAVTIEQCADDCAVDVIAPMVICNNGIAIDLNGGIVDLFPSDVDGGSFDNCGIASMSLDKTTFDCSDVGTNTITLTVVDLKGNTSSCVTTILVQDNSGNCNCDGEDLQISGNPITPDDYKVNNMITSDGTVGTTTTVLFQAGNTITLQPGFTVEPGAIFSAKIAPCANPNLQTTETELSNFRLTTTPPIGETISLKIQPNPFRYQTTLVLNLSTLEKVNLRVFDQSGRMLKELLKDEILLAGKHEIALTDEFLLGGLFYISLQTETEHLMKKVIMISDGGFNRDDDD